LKFPSDESAVRLPGVSKTQNQIFLSVRLNGRDEDLRFVFDSGAGRTILDRRIAKRIGLQPTEKSSFAGVGTGRTEVDVIKNATIQLGALRLEHVDLNLVDDVHESGAAGIIGYDLLCSSVVALDYKQPGIVIQASSGFQYRGTGDVLPLTFKGRWAYVEGTLKVPGIEAITDKFLIDTGSEDAVNHPIIRKSKGELGQTRTGAGGFGESVPGVIGPNEWFKLGSTTLPSTMSVCCAANEDVNAQLGGAILSHFRIIFDYPESRVIFERN
jgi:hypothetical protein